VTVDHESLLTALSRLKLTAIRDQFDSLLDEAAKRELSLREALGFLVEREIGRKDERRIEMASKIAHFPTVRDLDGFDFAAQPSLDPRQIRELAACRWVAHGEALLLLGPPGSARRIWRSRWAAPRSAKATRCCSPPRRRWSQRSPRRVPRAGSRSGSASSTHPLAEASVLGPDARGALVARQHRPRLVSPRLLTAWGVAGVSLRQALSTVLTAGYWDRWQERLARDPSGPYSPYLAKILNTHWLRTFLVNANALILLSWAITVL
jgi:hypothetical protein